MNDAGRPPLRRAHRRWLRAHRRLLRLVVPPLLAVAALGGCGDDSGASADRTLTVLAASSLTGTFQTLADRFEAEHQGVRVSLAFDSSATLAQQVQEGAPADVLATADLETMRTVLDAGAAQAADTFATNRMVLVVPRDNPAGISSFADLDRGGVSFVTCVPSAPCGKVASRLLAENQVATPPRSLEVDVKAVLTKVAADEADAGLVYATDAVAAGGTVRSFPIPGAGKLPNAYAIAVVGRARDPELAQAWVDLVLSDAGQTVLHDAGFRSPTAGR